MDLDSILTVFEEGLVKVLVSLRVCLNNWRAYLK